MRIYVANRDSGTVSVLDASTNTLTATLALGRVPEALALPPTEDGCTSPTDSNTSLVAIHIARVTILNTVQLDGVPEGAGCIVGWSRRRRRVPVHRHAVRRGITLTRRRLRYPPGARFVPGRSDFIDRDVAPSQLVKVQTASGQVMHGTTSGGHGTGQQVSPDVSHVYLPHRSDGQ
jgi:YVTN family beta-propeller protein